MSIYKYEYINTLLNQTRLSSEIQSFINIFAESGYYNMIDKSTRIIDIHINKRDFYNQNQNARKKYITLLDKIYPNVPNCYQLGNVDCVVK